MDLPVKYKAFWFYICDQCDIAGVWEPNMRLAVAQIGEPIELVEILRVFDKRIEQLPDGKLWIKKFIAFQQGTQLNMANHYHRGVLKRLRENKMNSPLPIKVQTRSKLGPTKPQRRTTGNSNSNSTITITSKSNSTRAREKPSDEEVARAQRIAKEEVQKLKAHFNP